MAGAHIAAATPPSPFPLPPPPPTPRVTSPSSLPSSFPPRRTRTNHLRQKILKTLENKPYPDPSRPESPPHQTHPVSVQETLQQQDSFEGEQLLEPAGGFVGGILGDFSTKSVAKVGLYLVGAFVFQTICAVLIFGSNDLFGNDENLDGNENGKKVRPKRSSLPLGGNLSNQSGGSSTEKEGGVVSVDELEMDNRIMEIQEMARRAREQEMVEAKRKGVVEEEDEDGGFDSVDMAVKMKEVDERLSKMRKSLEGEYQKPAPMDDESLMFKKKYKFKSPSVDLGDKPKGFGGAKDSYGANGTMRDVVTADDGTLRNDKKDDRETLSDDVESGSEVSVGKDENKEQEPRATRTESIAGTSKELEYDKQTSKSEKSGKSTKKPRGFGKESSAMTTKHDDLNKNGSLKGVKGWTKKPARNFEGKFSTQTNFWWTSLPCVMAVTMQSGGNGEESKGLFIISSTSGVPHTVAFEDRSDATNFCYLLESFFEDLPNFSTNIIPIPTNELEEEVKLQKMKVVVVKKRQLKLYVGQPLEDVESALRALIESE